MLELRPSQIAWQRYQETRREGDKLRMAAVVSLGGTMCLFALLMVLASLLR